MKFLKKNNFAISQKKFCPLTSIGVLWICKVNTYFMLSEYSFSFGKTAFTISMSILSSYCNLYVEISELGPNFCGVFELFVLLFRVLWRNMSLTGRGQSSCSPRIYFHPT